MFKSAVWIMLAFRLFGGPASPASAPRPDRSARGEQPAPQPHVHLAIDIEGAPLVARVPMVLEAPRRVAFDGADRLLVVDSAAGCVLRQSSDGTVATLLDGLHEPTGLAIDALGHVYVADHAHGEHRAGSIVRVLPDGSRETVIGGLTAPSCLAFGPDGTLYVGQFHTGRILAVDADGQADVFADDVSSPAGLVVGTDGSVFVANLAPGTITQITRDGQRHVLAGGLELPSDLAWDSTGRLIVACYGGAELARIDARGRIEPLARVPVGTIGVAVDHDDNLLVVNRDLRLLTKVTLNLSVPCPHCGGQIPLRLRPAPRRSLGLRRSVN